MESQETNRREETTAAATLNIEIRVVENPHENPPRSEELWINGKWRATYPRLLDGNQVAHSIALILHNEYGIDASYKLVLPTDDCQEGAINPKEN